jgi:hypothetical protein
MMMPRLPALMLAGTALVASAAAASRVGQPARPAPPPTTRELLATLNRHAAEVRRTIGRGAFAQLYAAAFDAKAIAISLEGRVGELPPDRQDVAEAAIATLVRAAWLLDAFGDIGRLDQVEAVHAAFTASEADIQRAFGGRR